MQDFTFIPNWIIGASPSFNKFFNLIFFNPKYYFLIYQPFVGLSCEGDYPTAELF